MDNNKDKINNFAFARSPNMIPRIDLCRAERVLIRRSIEEKDSGLNELEIKQMCGITDENLKEEMQHDN